MIYISLDYGGATQGFDGGQSFDDRLMARHTMQAKCQGDGNHRGQSFGNGGNRQRDGRHKHFRPGFAAQQSADKHDHDDHTGDKSEVFTQAIKLNLQRSGGLLGGTEQAGHPPHLSLHAGCCD